MKLNQVLCSTINMRKRNNLCNKKTLFPCTSNDVRFISIAHLLLAMNSFDIKTTRRNTKKAFPMI